MQLLYAQRLSRKPETCRKLTQTKEKVQTFPSRGPENQNPLKSSSTSNSLLLCEMCLKDQQSGIAGLRCSPLGWASR